ncbi:alpha/beta hydrolase domain-containing protein 11-like [Achlya hypogyna]|uniref:Alpha/beta hydrolase domain-containing protein 11-like n=1 Tax=Achlya hypogyna TaxID=1202772 RepID=A0A1V9ZJW9_ACHHY|nr:alpha/beta hydrolase domain-containing protein 11-like [Achlya hypogyna]
MSKEGYLIRHGPTVSEIVYCVLADGKVRFYDERHGAFIDEVGLSKTKLKIRGATPAEAYQCDHSFHVSVCRTQLVNGRQNAIGTPENFMLSAPSNAERKEWGNAIHSWQRHYWREPLHTALNMTPDEEEEFFRTQYHYLYDLLKGSLRGKFLTNRRSLSASNRDESGPTIAAVPKSVDLSSLPIAMYSCAKRAQSTLAHTIVGGASLDKAKKTIFIMHGILGNKGNWGTFCRRIVNTYPNWQVVAIDHRAHGESPSFSPPHNLAACAQDVIDLSDALGVVPDVVSGHSYGGKVALTYLDACRRQGRPVPKDTWVLDALPGCAQTDYSTRTTEVNFSSTDHVLPALLSVPLPIKSKRELVAVLEAKGFETGQAQWMTTNLKPTETNADEFEWKMNLPVIDIMFKAFLATDCWPIIEHPPRGASIHFVRAEYNKFWTPEVLARFATLPPSVHVHLLPKADHWVHVDNPSGLFAMVESSLA